jgi:hypothetical protein
MQEEAATFTIFVAAFLDLLAQSLPRVCPESAQSLPRVCPEFFYGGFFSRVLSDASRCDEGVVILTVLSSTMHSIDLVPPVSHCRWSGHGCIK